MQQYFEIKNEYKETLLFFQVGDFYELFFEDAKNAAGFLGIALTKRGNINGESIPLCGVPVHALDHYLAKLIKGGFNVAICDQLEEAVPGRVVKRGITQVLTPGTLTDPKLLNEKSSSYILFFVENSKYFSLFFVELLTGHIFYTKIKNSDLFMLKILEAELYRFFPDEIVLSNNNFASYFKKLGFVVSIFSDSISSDWAKEKLFKIKDDCYEDLLNLLYSYFAKNNPEALNHFGDFYNYKLDDFLILDAATQRNLEIVSNNQDGSRRNTLFYLMDRAVTSMGSRMIKKWLLRPLVKLDAINNRLKTVELFVDEVSLKEKLILLLKEVADLERVVGRISLSKAQLHDYIHLKNALKVFPDIKNLLSKLEDNNFINLISKKINNFDQLYEILEISLNDDLSKDLIIKDSFSERLDNIRKLVNQSHIKILQLEQAEQKFTGINSLKIRFNQVFGYYIEITKVNLNLVPENYTRTQTLSNRERFTTPELKILESEIEKAKREIVSVEKEIFDKIKSEVYSFISQLKKSAYALSHLDALICFAQVAYENNYVMPQFSDTKEIVIENGKHPVVAQNVENFIPNSTNFSFDSRLWIITGPNMGGKSTYLRQTALICLLAQCGSFVPAKSAKTFLLDRIFTRIGAGDNLAEGKSTFLVEMEETATICRQATERSLVILDEVGRGTSTYDGLALAQSVIEYIYNNIKAYCLFATHYHELTELEKNFPGIVSYYASSQKTEDGILFLHKIVQGAADGSFGIEVAKLAQLPDEIISRATEILLNLSKEKNVQFVPAKIDHQEKSKIDSYKKLSKILDGVDLNELTPKASFDLIWKLKEILLNKN